LDCLLFMLVEKGSVLCCRWMRGSAIGIYGVWWQLYGIWGQQLYGTYLLWSGDILTASCVTVETPPEPWRYTGNLRHILSFCLFSSARQPPDHLAWHLHWTHYLLDLGKMAEVSINTAPENHKYIAPVAQKNWIITALTCQCFPIHQGNTIIHVYSIVIHIYIGWQMGVFTIRAFSVFLVS